MVPFIGIPVDTIFFSPVLNLMSYRGRSKREILELFTLFILLSFNEHRLTLRYFNMNIEESRVLVDWNPPPGDQIFMNYPFDLLQYY